MAYPHHLYWKSIRSSLDQANKLVQTPLTDITLQEVRAAATQAMQAAIELHQLAGAMDGLINTGYVPPSVKE